MGTDVGPIGLRLDRFKARALENYGTWRVAAAASDGVGPMTWLAWLLTAGYAGTVG